MPTISGSVSVAANSRSLNIFAGESFEFITRPAVLSLFMSAEENDTVEADVLIGGRSVAQGADIADTDRTPLRQEDGVVQFAAVPGDRVFVQLLNIGVGAAAVKYILDISFVA